MNDQSETTQNTTPSGMLENEGEVCGIPRTREAYQAILDLSSIIDTSQKYWMTTFRTSDMQPQGPPTMTIEVTQLEKETEQ